MDGMGRIRVFRGDEQEGTAGDFGPVHQSVDSDQSLMYILRVIWVKYIVPKRLIPVIEVGEHERILALEVPVEGGFGYGGNGHDLLRPGSADSLLIEEAVRDLQYPCARIGLLARFHKFILTQDRHDC